jgi:mono/diheme cytochrome c family protein
VEGVDPEAIQYIRIAQRVAWPYTIAGGGERYEPDVKAVMVNWTPVRVLGTVAVEDDGSAYFLVPDDTPVYFQLLDKDFMELRRMRSFVSFQPGEVRSCVGCHATRPEAPAPAAFPKALASPPRVLEPPPWGSDRALSFLRDVQPVFDRHCTSCHGGLSPAGKLDLTGGLTTRHNRAYDSIQEHGLVSRSNVGEDARITQPLEFGSHKSKLIQVLLSGKHREEMTVGQEDWVRLVTWIDGNAPYHDGFINKRSEPRPYDLPADRELAATIRSVHERRCNSCHDNASHEAHTAAAVTRLDWIDLRQPERSRFLRAPLARAAGGAGTCGSAVYAGRDDPDYGSLLDTVKQAVRRAWARPRRDLRALADKQVADGLARSGE